jgi:hypothetical protein
VIRSLFELRDLGKLKLFLADTLEPADALDLIAALHRRSEDLLVRLHRESEPGARLLDENGVRFPMLTLRLGLAFPRSNGVRVRGIRARTRQPQQRPRATDSAQPGSVHHALQRGLRNRRNRVVSGDETTIPVGQCPVD